ncbi:hypothetical protein ACSHT0_17365 [Tepidicaulis sp. LMO-SS28]|uniref:hypothetical protein n=1 Tax=Tepidicaulis sp. LMO-SS28 TaxID=3447455 RepID=UPI003EDF04A7
MINSALTRRLRAATLTLSLVVAVPSIGYAAMAVVDTGAIAQLAQQMNKLQEQVDQLRQQTEWLDTLSTQVQDQINAIGEMGQLTLPTLNLQQLTGQVMRDAQCLKPDFEKLMPGLSSDELNFDSICGGSHAYEKALWFDPNDPESWPEGIAWEEDGTSEEKWANRAAARAVIEARRRAVTKDAASKGMAQADKAATDTAELNQKASEELEAATRAAKTQQDRLAVVAQGQVLTNRQLVQQNQLLAQLLKVQSTMLMEMSLSSTERGAVQEEGGE